MGTRTSVANMARLSSLTTSSISVRRKRSSETWLPGDTSFATSPVNSARRPSAGSMTRHMKPRRNTRRGSTFWKPSYCVLSIERLSGCKRLHIHFFPGSFNWFAASSQSRATQSIKQFWWWFRVSYGRMASVSCHFKHLHLEWIAWLRGKTVYWDNGGAKAPNACCQSSSHVPWLLKLGFPRACFRTILDEKGEPLWISFRHQGWWRPTRWWKTHPFKGIIRSSPFTTTDLSPNHSKRNIPNTVSPPAKYSPVVLSMTSQMFDKRILSSIIDACSSSIHRTLVVVIQTRPTNSIITK